MQNPMKPWNVKFVPIILLFAAVSARGFAEIEYDKVFAEALRRGIEAYEGSAYADALGYLNAVLSEPQAGAYHADAGFWMGKTLLAAGVYPEATANIERALSSPDLKAGNRIEAEYLKARLLLLQSEYEAAVEAFERFIATRGESGFVPYAYFWAAEALYELGRYDGAEKIFSYFIAQHPSHPKAEAASYRLSLIGFAKKEQELLKLLTWSHEETMRSIDEFGRRERELRDALDTYRARLDAVGTSDLTAKAAELSDTVNALKLQLEARNREIERLKAEIAVYQAGIKKNDTAAERAAVTTADRATAAGNLLDLVSVKQDALALKAFYLDLLATSGGAAR